MKIEYGTTVNIIKIGIKSHSTGMPDPKSRIDEKIRNKETGNKTIKSGKKYISMSARYFIPVMNFIPGSFHSGSIVGMSFKRFLTNSM
jgi:hypothetical protein